MLGLFFIYFIGKNFYELADFYNRGKWLYAVLGVVFYYLGTFVFGFTFGILDAIFEWDFVESASDTFLGVLFAPFGILTCVLWYKYLSKKWKQKYDNIDELVDGFGTQEEIKNNEE